MLFTICDEETSYMMTEKYHVCAETKMFRGKIQYDKGLWLMFLSREGYEKVRRMYIEHRRTFYQ